MAYKRQKPGGGNRGLHQNKGEMVNFAIKIHHTLPFPPCQESLELSPDSLSRAAFLIGDLGVFLLGKLPCKVPNPQFLPIFERALLCLEIEDTLLRKAGAMEAGQ